MESAKPAAGGECSFVTGGFLNLGGIMRTASAFNISTGVTGFVALGPFVPGSRLMRVDLQISNGTTDPQSTIQVALCATPSAPRVAADLTSAESLVIGGESAVSLTGVVAFEAVRGRESVVNLDFVLVDGGYVCALLRWDGLGGAIGLLSALVVTPPPVVSAPVRKEGRRRRLRIQRAA